jgi:hypothetical protein
MGKDIAMATPNVWVSLDPKFRPDDLGFLWDILIPDDTRTVKAQLDDRYAHGGGYEPFPGFKLERMTMRLKYPGDPPLRPSAMTQIGDEKVFYYQKGSWLLILQPDDTYEVTRVD